MGIGQPNKTLWGLSDASGGQVVVSVIGHLSGLSLKLYTNCAIESDHGIRSRQIDPRAICPLTQGQARCNTRPQVGTGILVRCIHAQRMRSSNASDTVPFGCAIMAVASIVISSQPALGSGSGGSAFPPFSLSRSDQQPLPMIHRQWPKSTILKLSPKPSFSGHLERFVYKTSVFEREKRLEGIRLTRDSSNTTIVTQNVQKVRSWQH